MKCPYNGCPNTYTTFSGIKSHVYNTDHDTFHEIPSAYHMSDDERTVEKEDANEAGESISEENVCPSRKETYKEVSEDLQGLHAYALDVLCLPRQQIAELTSRVEGIVSDFCSNIANDLDRNGDANDMASKLKKLSFD